LFVQAVQRGAADLRAGDRDFSTSEPKGATKTAVSELSAEAD